jgi:uncharacterized protein YbjT (DUF2867 family)
VRRALVIGGTGFTGSHVLPLLLARGWTVRALVRPASGDKTFMGGEVEWICGDLNDPDALVHAMKGVDVLINLASLGFGHAPNLVLSALKSKIRRALFLSTTAVFTTLNASSKATRLSAEEMIQKSELNYTLLRPTMIYGNSRDRNMCRLIGYLRRWPVIPVLGDGSHLQQPVYVEDVAKAVEDSLSSYQTERKSYNIPGAKALSYNEVIDTISGLLKRKVARVHLPASPCVSILRCLESMGLRGPIRSEQISRLNENKAFDFREATHDFGYQPRLFEEGILSELKEMRILS